MASPIFAKHSQTLRYPVEPRVDDGNRWTLLAAAPKGARPVVDRLCDACRYTMPANETVCRASGCRSAATETGVQFYGNLCRGDLLLQIAPQIEEARPERFANLPPLHVGMGDLRRCAKLNSRSGEPDGSSSQRYRTWRAAQRSERNRARSPPVQRGRRFRR